MTDPGNDPGNESPRRPPVAANSGAVGIVGLDLNSSEEIPRRRVWSWAMWDWATQPFNTVIVTFVFTSLYLTTDVFLDPAVAALADDSAQKKAGLADLASGLGVAVALAGLSIAILAPVLGQRSDAAGRRKRWLLINTAALALVTGLLFFVEATPSFFVLGVSLVGIGTVLNELAGVNYNAMMVQVATPRTVGRVSGLGWGFGYVGGIIALVIVIVANGSDWFGLPQEGGLPFRLVAVGCALWTVIFTIPYVLWVPEFKSTVKQPRVSFFASYGVLIRDVVELFRRHRPTFWFLLASAVYRDGLAGVFTFGAIIAGTVFGFTFEQVVSFGIAANLIAGVSTVIAGRFDDRFGPRAIIITALVGLIVAGLVVFLLRDGGDWVFWVFGLLLTAFVGPAQAASRSLLARVTPVGREGQIFGLYATTGRAASFLSASLWALTIAIFSSAAFGILGIMLVLLFGLVLMLLVRLPRLTTS